MMSSNNNNGTPLLFEEAEITNGSINALPHPQCKRIRDSYGLPAYELDIHFTIPELAYLTHNFYRYYGKYPSVLGGFLIEKYAQNKIIFDNYLGCGTSLVEAAIRGLDSSGIDINPIAVLASNVKTRLYKDLAGLENYLNEILTRARNNKSLCASYIPDWKYLSKWFNEERVWNLAKVKKEILSLKRTVNREFAALCFLAIIRRCSNAYDGEVRPHFNPSKIPRNPFEAFRDKADDMLSRERVFIHTVPSETGSTSFCASNVENDLKKYMPFGVPSLVISHPPYLNCFNYYSVFSLENVWAQGLEEAEQEKKEDWIKENEHKCWPAADPKIVETYFENLENAYTNLRKNVGIGTKLAVVIGDSTVYKKLIPVLKEIVELLPRCGFRPIEIVYRTTHYGIGKYAYRSRADYHGNSHKKDGVIISEAV